MDRRRLIVVGCAAIAAIAAIFLMRALIGGGTPKVAAAVAPPQVETVQVLVATQALQPGAKLTPALVRWQAWPKTAVDATFVTPEKVTDLTEYTAKAYVRAPMVAGEPVSDAKIVQANSASFMSATLTPGMRAVSVGISAETGAGGFILPNDRVDVMKTAVISDNPRRYRASTILENVRVLSIDQTSKKGDEQQYVVGRTATLELTPDQAKLIARASASGALSLALRALTEQDAQTARQDDVKSYTGEVQIIRYGVVRADAAIQSKE